MGKARLRCACGGVSELKVIVPRLVGLIGYPKVSYTCDTCWRIKSVREERRQDETNA